MKIKKFCSQCQQARHPDTGHYIVRKGVTRWLCDVCAARKNISPYEERRDE